MTVLTPSNALPGAPFQQHLASQTTTVTSYVYPGAVQPQSTLPAVLSYTNALPNAPFPQHLAGQTTTVQAFIFPGAVQPSAAGAAFTWLGMTPLSEPIRLNPEMVGY
jgi:hypothetical protein